MSCHVISDIHKWSFTKISVFSNLFAPSDTCPIKTNLKCIQRVVDEKNQNIESSRDNKSLNVFDLLSDHQ